MSHIFSRCLAFFAVVAGTFFFVLPSLAATGDVRITIQNEAREPVVGATVEIHCTDWSAAPGTTNDSGALLVNPVSVDGAGCYSGSTLEIRVSSSTFSTQTYPLFGTGMVFDSAVNPEATSTYREGITNNYRFGIETSGTYALKYWNMMDDPTSLDFPTRDPDAVGTSLLTSVHWPDSSSPTAGINDSNWTANFHKSVLTGAGWYEFDLGADDGGRVLVDGIEVPVLDSIGNNAWRLQSFGTFYSGKKYLSAGVHDIDVEYYQATGGTRIAFTFYPIDDMPAYLTLSHGILSPMNDAVSTPTIVITSTKPGTYAVHGSTCSGGGFVGIGSSPIALTLTPLDGDHSGCSVTVTDPVTMAESTLSIPDFSVTSGTPIHAITSCEQLQTVGRNPNTYLDTIELASVGDTIDCDGIDFLPMDFAGHDYTGTFDGHDKTIANLTINRPGTTEVGLFSSVAHGTIQNVVLAGGNVIGADQTGALAGVAQNEVVTNVTSTVSVIGMGMGDTGGLIGSASVDDGGTYAWTNLSVQADITGSFDTGGVIGSQYLLGSGSSLSLDGLSFDGTILPTYTDVYVTGGLIGYMENNRSGASTSTLSLMHSSASTTLNCNGGFGCGGFIGLIYADGQFGPTQTTINECTSTALMDGSGSGFGGFVGLVEMEDRGSNVNVTIASSTADVVMTGTGNSVGGFIGGAGVAGQGDEVHILLHLSHDYATGTVSGSNDVGGFLGGTSGEGPMVYTLGLTTGGLQIDRSYFSGSITATGVGSGGFAGNLNCTTENIGNPFTCSIEESYAIGRLEGGAAVGGFLGMMNAAASVGNSYSNFFTSGAEDVGGFVGYMESGSRVFNSYAIGSVTSGSSDAGGFVGLAGGGTISHNFAAGLVESGYGFINDPGSATLFDNYYDAIATGQIDCSSIGTVEGCQIFDTLGAPDASRLLNTVIAPPLNAWDFNTIWSVHETDYPTLTRVVGAPPLPVGEDIPMLGSGVEDDPYEITNCTQLQNVQNDLTAYYQLANDIDCTETASWNEGWGFLPLGNPYVFVPFSGFFDGAHHTISHLTIHNSVTSFVGLFGVIFGGVVQNVTFSDATVTQDNSSFMLSDFAGAGVLTGAMGAAVIRGVQVVDSRVESYVPVGGIVGLVFNEGGSFSDQLYSTNDISYSAVNNTSVSSTGGYSVAGGMVGVMLGASIDNVYASTTVTAEAGAGGLIGSAAFGRVRNAYATGNVSSTVLDTEGMMYIVPGLGGLVGGGGMFEIHSSFSAAFLSGAEVRGAMIGQSFGTSFQNDFYDATRVGIPMCTGMSSDDVSACTAVNEDGMSPDSFQNTSVASPYRVEGQAMWDFDHVWLQTLGYPSLRPFVAPPHVPENINVVGDAYTTTTVSWNAPSSTSEGTITGYYLEYIVDGGAWGEAATSTVDGDTYSIDLPPHALATSTNYVFRVRAFQDGPEDMPEYGFPSSAFNFSTTDLESAPPVDGPTYTTSTWIGTVSTDWDDASNWDHGVPASTTNAVIPFIESLTTISLSSTSTMHSLQIGAEMSLSLGGHALQMTGGSLVNQGRVILRGDEEISGLVQDTTEGTWEYRGMGDSVPHTVTIHRFGSRDYYHLILNATNPFDTFQLMDDLHVVGNLILSSGLLKPNAQNTEYESGLVGEYSSSEYFNSYVTTTIDQEINFPSVTSLQNDVVHEETFNARWEGQVYADDSETYTFCTVSDDGARLWINGQNLLNDWTIHADYEQCATIPLEAGSWNDIRLDYDQHGGPGSIMLSSSSFSHPRAIIPSDHLRHGRVYGFEVRVDGDWIRAGGGYDAYQAAVVFGGVDQTIYGNEVFYDFSKINTEDASLTFGDGAFVQFLHSVHLEGASDHLLHLTSPGDSAWYVLMDDATKELTNVAVRHGINVGRHMVVIQDGTSTYDGFYGWQVNNHETPHPIGFSAGPGYDSVEISWDLDNRLDASTTLQYGVTTSYGHNIILSPGDTDTIFGDLTPGTLYHYRVLVTDASGNFGVSEDQTFTTRIPDLTPPVLSAIHVEAATTSASIAWVTDENATTQVSYSPSPAYTSSTGLMDGDPMVTEHAATLTSLLPCVTYHYKLFSLDFDENLASSTDATFTTLGCEGGDPLVTASTMIDSTVTSTAHLTYGEHVFTVTTPPAFTTAASDIVLQLRALDRSTILSHFGSPDGHLDPASSVVFDARAILDSGTSLDLFDLPVTVQYHYAADELSGLLEGSLWIYHYHSGAWSALDACTIDRDARTITCLTPGFSSFGLFAAPAPRSEGGSGGGSSNQGGGSGGTPIAVYGCTNPSATNYNSRATNMRFIGECEYRPGTASSTHPTTPSIPSALPALPSSVAVPATQLNCSTALSVSGPIRYGMKNDPAQVTLIQRYLNTYEQQSLPVDGMYSVQDRDVVIRWQEKYAADILKPVGLTKGTGNLYDASLKKMRQLHERACSASRKPSSTIKKFIFTRTLKAGDTGEDVRQLQIFLNTHGYPVSVSGNGSKGKETSVFGPALGKALSKFQADRAETLLKPFGLKNPTGIFGEATKKTVNSLP